MVSKVHDIIDCTYFSSIAANFIWFETFSYDFNVISCDFKPTSWRFEIDDWILDWLDYTMISYNYILNFKRSGSMILLANSLSILSVLAWKSWHFFFHVNKPSFMRKQKLIAFNMSRPFIFKTNNNVKRLWTNWWKKLSNKQSGDLFGSHFKRIQTNLLIFQNLYGFYFNFF